MGIMDFLLDAWDNTRKFDPLGHKALETVAKQDSRIAESLGNKLGWQWLENQGKQNVEDPRRAIAHGSLGAAAYFAGPWLWGSGAGGKAAATTAAEEGLKSSGLFAMEQGGINSATQQAMLEQLAQQQAAQQAAEEAAKQGLSSGGLFSQVPGVAPDSAQWNALMQQAQGFGGQGADLTAKAAMPAVKDAYASGNMGALDYLGNVAKGDMAGMNDPSVWLDRATANLSRAAGKAGKGLAQNYAQQALAPRPQGGPAPMPRPQQVQPPPQIGNDADKRQALADFKAGIISEDELRRRLGVYA